MSSHHSNLTIGWLGEKKEVEAACTRTGELHARYLLVRAWRAKKSVPAVMRPFQLSYFNGCAVLLLVLSLLTRDGACVCGNWMS